MLPAAPAAARRIDLFLEAFPGIIPITNATITTTSSNTSSSRALAAAAGGAPAGLGGAPQVLLFPVVAWMDLRLLRKAGRMQGPPKQDQRRGAPKSHEQCTCTIARGPHRTGRGPPTGTLSRMGGPPVIPGVVGGVRGAPITVGALGPPPQHRH